MSHSKKLISDSVLYKLAGGIPMPGFPVQERDIWSAIDSKMNALFKIKHFDTTLPSGETIPENTMIATYENNTVTSFGEVSKVSLPITPISFPKSMGIFLVYDPKFPDNPFIPLQRGQKSLLNADELLNDLNGQIGYEPKNNVLIFTKDITLFDITSVTMELCVFDTEGYSVTDPLPIPADMIDTIEGQLMEEFAPVLAKSGIVNNFVNPSQNIPK
jgi:hypothetical protein